MKKTWWKEKVIYQIYPRSFKDSNGDGIGDLRGILSKLDYLEELGIDIIWLSPVYQSPNDDNGYDISDYYNIHSEFGTMKDFDELLRSIHDRGMRLLMDLVVNHTSDEHEWFQNSKKSTDNPYRDYYFWRKGKGGNPPNNWKSFFGGPAWEYDEETKEYYLHLFTKKQPDLNWENPEVREKVFEIIQFWIDKGVDGFRMDVIPLISKRSEFSNTPIKSFNQVVEKVYSNGPKIHDYIQEMYRKVLKNHDIVTVGEGPGINTSVGLDYVGHDRGELNMIFHLDHMFLGHGAKGKFDPLPYDWKEIKQIFQKWYDAMGDSGWISIFLDNHDFPRLVSRFGNDTLYRVESAKLLALLILTMRGTPSIYQGSEIGMTNVRFFDIEDYKDIETLNFYEEAINDGKTETEFLSLVHEHGRDNARTPMQWSNKKYGNFTNTSPWIGMNPNYTKINATDALVDKASIFHWYKDILSFRKRHLTLVYGEWEVLGQTNEDLYIYKRWDEENQFLIVLNHSNDIHPFDMDISNYEICFNNVSTENLSILLPWEARLYKKIN